MCASKQHTYIREQLDVHNRCELMQLGTCMPVPDGAVMLLSSISEWRETGDAAVAVEWRHLVQQQSLPTA